MTNTVELVRAPARRSQRADRHEHIWVQPPDALDKAMLCVSTLFCGLLALWFALDHGYPYWDAACHVLTCIEYRDLLKHPHLFSGKWWHQLLTVNYCYAPQLHLWGGFLKLFFGKGLLSDHISLVIFCAILNFSTFNIARQIFENRLAAVSSVIVINAIPLVSTLSHLPLLDYPHLALHALAMLTLLRWQKDPSWTGTIVLGNVLGLAVCAKQVASFFLIAPCLAALCICLWRRRYPEVIKLVAAGAIASLWLAVWVIPNYEAMHGFTVRNNLVSGSTSPLELTISHFRNYIGNVPVCLSPLFTGILAGSILLGARTVFSKTWMFLLSSIVGVLLLSGMVFQNPEDRYMIPAFLWMALVCGYGIAELMQRRTRQVRVAGMALAFIGLMQYIAFNFTPYPVSNRLMVSLTRELGLDLGTFSYKWEPSIHPTQPGDPWGQEWVIDQIKKVDGNAPSWFYIMPNDPRYNVHTFSLIAALKDCPVKPTTLRVFTMSGEEVNDTANRVMHFRWYLFKSTTQPDVLSARTKNSESEMALRRLEDAVKHSEHFTLAGQRKVPDGSTVKLFRQK